MDDLDAEFLGEAVEDSAVGQVLDFLGVGRLELPLGDQGGADVEQALLGEVRDQAGIGAVLEHGRRPGSFHLAVIRRTFMCRQ